MKTTLSYKFDEDDRESLAIQANATNMFCAINSISEALRQEVKYKDLHEQMTLEAFQELFWETLNEYDIGGLF